MIFRPKPTTPAGRHAEPPDPPPRRKLDDWLKTLGSVLSHGDLAARASAAVVLRELASSADGDRNRGGGRGTRGKLARPLPAHGAFVCIGAQAGAHAGGFG